MSAITPTHAFRDCEVTGFRISLAAQRHTLANAVAAVLLLAMGGTFAILIALQRQGLPISDEWWYRLLASHGATMLLFWILFFEVGALYFGSTV
ncbi:MAG: hypothetical protein WD575_00680, partial [Nitriliruptoraceae bacterium]